MSRTVNGVLLRPLGLRLTTDIPRNPINDMRQLLRTQDVNLIVDGGGHVGRYSVALARVFPKARIITFEPCSETFASLQQNVARFKAIEPVRLALGAKNEKQTLLKNASSGASSLRQPTAEGDRYFAETVTQIGSEEVEVVSLQTFCKERGIHRIDVLKLDLQGHEMDAIVGMEELIGSTSIIFSEVHFVETYAGSPLFSDIESYLRNKEFDFYRFYDLVHAKSDGRLIYGDAMFVRRELLSRPS